MLQNKSQTNIFNQSKTRNYKIIYTTQEPRIEFNRKTVSVSIRKKRIFKQRLNMVNYNIQAGAVANYLWGPICFPCLYLWSLENFRQIKSWHEITLGEDKLRLAWVGWTRGRGGPGIVSSDKCDSDESEAIMTTYKLRCTSVYV